jgi:cleavage and polyadenylation specificity factor subunit 2
MLASDASLDWGFSLQALQSLAADSRNLVILTETAAQLDPTSKGMARQLWEMYQNQQGRESGAKVVDGNGQSVELRDYAKETLTTEEDMLYQQYMARQRQMHSALQGDTTAAGDTAADLDDGQASDSSDSEDEDDDGEHQGRAFNVSAQLTQNKRKAGLTDMELGVNVLLRGKNVHDYDVRNKRGREKMFPFVAHRARDDDFGDAIKPEEYLRAEERDDVDGIDLKNANAASQEGNAAVGQKRKWDDNATAKGKKDRDQRTQNKKAKVEQQREPDDIDAIIARATGEAGTGGNAPATVNGTADESTSDSDESEYEPEEDGATEPQKIVYSSRYLQLNMRIAYVDFSGLYRLNDLQGLIGRINPRKLIVTGGDASDTQLVAETCRAVDSGSAVGEIFTPLDGETVDASVDTNAWTVKLTRQLVRKLNWKDLGTDKPSIAAISGLLGLDPVDEESKADEDAESAKTKLKLTKPSQQPAATEQAALPILDILSNTAYGHAQRGAQPVHVGDLRLADIRSAISAQGHTAEFRGGGTLLVDGTVIVRKSPTTGGIELEAANEGLNMPGWRTMTNEGTFYAVKRVIYERLAVVAGA